jgi:N-glycosylase/DNA lyase
MLQLTTNNFSLQHTLSSGQTFCWGKTKSDHSDEWKGYIYDIPCLARQAGNILTLESPLELSESLVRYYFNLNPEWQKVLSCLPDEPWLNRARDEVAGLSCVHEPWWECTANFICSSLKQIPQIEQINQNLRKNFGQAIPGTSAHRFPTPEELAVISEEDLRSCKLGYRARHLSRAARQIIKEAFSWQALAETSLPLEVASAKIESLPGVGEKVAHCILLYAGNRYDAFPFDVWVFRLMHDLYYPHRRQIPSRRVLHRKSLLLFGEYRGIAQQFLFHWYRTCYSKTKQTRVKD